jgi:hypothetical protein
MPCVCRAASVVAIVAAGPRHLQPRQDLRLVFGARRARGTRRVGLQSAVEILMVPVAALAVSHAPASPLYGYSSSVAKPLLIAYSMPYGPLAPQSMSCSDQNY